MLRLQMDAKFAAGYISNSQIVRKVTEAWASSELYCSSCHSKRIEPTPNNSQSIDFRCEKCSAVYQLKAGKNWNERRVPDAGYKAMIRALRSDQVPNLLIMQYTEDWKVRSAFGSIVFLYCFRGSEANSSFPKCTTRGMDWV